MTPAVRRVATAASTSAMSAMPVESTTGSPSVPTTSSIGRLVTSPDEILMRRTPSRFRNRALSGSNGVDMNSMPTRAQWANSISWSAGESCRRASISYWVCSRPVARCWYSALAAVRVSRRSTLNVWNLTASARASTAASTRARASAGSPL